MGQPLDDFNEILNRAQRVTTDVGGPFGDAGAGRVAFQPGAVRGMPAFDFDAKVAVFNLPSDSGEYEEVLNQCLRGEAVIRYEERTFTKEGDFLVALCYLTPREPAAEAAGAAAGEAGDREPVDRPERLA